MNNKILIALIIGVVSIVGIILYFSFQKEVKKQQAEILYAEQVMSSNDEPFNIFSALGDIGNAIKSNKNKEEIEEEKNV